MRSGLSLIKYMGIKDYLFHPVHGLSWLPGSLLAEIKNDNQSH